MRAALPALPAQRRSALAEAAGLEPSAEVVVTAVERGLDAFVLEAVAAGAEPRTALNRAVNDLAVGATVSVGPFAALVGLEVGGAGKADSKAVKGNDGVSSVTCTFTFLTKLYARLWRCGMAFTFLGPDPVAAQVEAVLAAMAGGRPPSEIECTQVDVKEEPGRRGRGGAVTDPVIESAAAARYLAAEMACFANTPGGGAIIVGVADGGARIGTGLDAAWLRHRIYELTDRRLTVDVAEVDLDGCRLLVLTTHEAIEPIAVDRRVRWRVGDHCIDVDPTTWHTGRLQRIGVDWSALASGHRVADVSVVAVDLARRYLRAAGDASAMDLADASTDDLLARIHVVDGDGRLTNAGSLMFVGTPSIGLDYLRRDVAGGDSTNRIEGTGPLLEQLWAVDQATQTANRITHVPGGFAQGQRRALPELAAREAIVNGVAHRDWLAPLPTTVEHVGDTLTVTSPGGFIGGVSPANIITHPAVARYRGLAQAMAALRLAEREGIGIDRIVRDLLAAGRPGPQIAEIPGPYVRITLLGGAPDPEFMALLAALEPASARADVDILLLLERLTRHGWVDDAVGASVSQRSRPETQAALERLTSMTIDDDSAVVPVKGVPPGHPLALRLTSAAQARLPARTQRLRTPAGRAAMITEWAGARGRVSSTEAAALTGLSTPRAGALLSALEEQGILAPGRPNRVGRGNFYVPSECAGGVSYR